MSELTVYVVIGGGLAVLGPFLTWLWLLSQREPESPAMADPLLDTLAVELERADRHSFYADDDLLTRLERRPDFLLTDRRGTGVRGDVLGVWRKWTVLRSPSSSEVERR